MSYNLRFRVQGRDLGSPIFGSGFRAEDSGSRARDLRVLGLEWSIVQFVGCRVNEF
jgi:hypothetical protein